MVDGSVELYIQHRMQLDAVARITALAMREVEHANAGNPHRYGNILKDRRRSELGIELLPRAGDTRTEWTRAMHATGMGNLGDHGHVVLVNDNEVVVGVARGAIFDLERSQNNTPSQ